MLHMVQSIRNTFDRIYHNKHSNSWKMADSIVKIYLHKNIEISMVWWDELNNGSHRCKEVSYTIS